MYGTRPSTASSFSYWHYVDDQKGYVYYLILYHAPNWYDYVILLKKHLIYDDIRPSIIAYFGRPSSWLRKDQNLLWSRITSLMAYQNGNKLYISRLLKDYRRGFNYNHINEIIIDMQYPIFRFIGAKHNRTMTLKYYNAEFGKIDEARVNRRYNIVIWDINGLMGREKVTLRVPIILSELTITKNYCRGLLKRRMLRFLICHRMAVVSYKSLLPFMVS